MTELICKNLSIGYDNSIVVDNLSFEVNSGDYLAIVGENGVGKSTLIKTILGLIKPMSGEIEFSNGLKRTDIGYLPQQTNIQKDFPASVLEVVLSGNVSKMGFRPFYNNEEKEKARKCLEKMELRDIEKKSYRDLSGGQQQRVLLARALCATEKILLLDEPVSSLDPKGTIDMYSIIRELNSAGTTIIMISHDLNSAIKDANKVLHIGHNIFFGEKNEYLNSEIGKRFIGMEI
ncbi:ABC transporter ATP-binding protein [bacterium]|nr:ABC transporter ATP-binding protein [bacterium]